MKFLTGSLLIGSLLLAGCAQQRGYTPTVDAYNNPNAHRIELDLQQCQQLAERSAGNTLQEGAIGGAIGGATGAATGAAVGAISGNSAGRGALGGAAIGAIGGAAMQGYKSDENYKRIYKNCMRERGHNVVD